MGGSSRIPMIKEMLEGYFLGIKPFNSINPDLVVSQGAAVQAAIFTGKASEKTNDVFLLDFLLI